MERRAKNKWEKQTKKRDLGFICPCWYQLHNDLSDMLFNTE